MYASDIWIVFCTGEWKFTSDQSLMYSVSAYSLEHYQPNHLDLIFFSPVFVCACVCVWWADARW